MAFSPTSTSSREDRLIAIGERLNSGTVVNNPAWLALYHIGDGGPQLLDRLTLDGPSAGTVTNSANPFRWFSQQRVLSYPVLDSNFGSGWTGSIWGGGDGVGWARIDSIDQRMDRIVSLGTHFHDQLVQHAAILNGSLTSVSTQTIISSVNEVDAPPARSGDLPLVASADDSVNATLELSDIRNDAREFLATHFGHDPASLSLSGIETRDQEVQILFMEGEIARLVTFDGAEFSLQDDSFEGHDNIFHNLELPWDANGDGRVTPTDALMIVNELATASSPLLSQPQNAIANRLDRWLDTNNDRALTARDALGVINYLSRENSAEIISSLLEPEAESLVDDAIIATQWGESLF